MIAKDFKVGDIFLLHSKGWERSRFEVLDKTKDSIRVKDQLAHGESPTWFFDNPHLNLYHERDCIELLNRKIRKKAKK